ncbi:tetratricopeptide repeat family protein, partial [Vibrio parahaemolyticus V-223/04]
MNSVHCRLSFRLNWNSKSGSLLLSPSNV